MFSLGTGWSECVGKILGGGPVAIGRKGSTVGGAEAASSLATIVDC